MLSRRSRDGDEGIEFATGDLATGEGGEAAVDGTEVIVHCAGTRQGDEAKARHLVGAAARTGTRYLVYISVVGADRIPVAGRVDRAMFGYFAAKLAAERVGPTPACPGRRCAPPSSMTCWQRPRGALARLPVVPTPAGFRFHRSTPARWPSGSRSLRWPRRPASCPSCRAAGV